MNKNPVLKATLNLNGVFTDFEVAITFSDNIRADVLRKRNKFPSAEEAPTVQAGLILYSALVRTNKIDANSDIEKFFDNIEWLEAVETDEEDSKSL